MRRKTNEKNIIDNFSFVILFAFDVNILASNVTLPQWDLDYLEGEVTSEEIEGFSVTNGAIPIFLDSIKYKGTDTKVFAWYGIPENASKDNPVPAIVLVHGGGGTASSSWVKTWVEKGYAAKVYKINDIDTPIEKIAVDFLRQTLLFILKTPEFVDVKKFDERIDNAVLSGDFDI